MLKLLILIIAIAEVFTLKCYDCNNFATGSCLYPENNKEKLLKECGPDETRCALLVEKVTDISIIRQCVTNAWQCDTSKFGCQTCETDACNTGKEIQKPINQVVTTDLVKSNIYPIGGFVILLTFVILWCVKKICCKKDEVEYEEEDDCDEYYENETNIDLEEPSIQHKY